MDDQHRRKVTAVGDAGSDLVRPSTLSALAKDAILIRIVTGEFAAGEVYRHRPSPPCLASRRRQSARPCWSWPAGGLVEAVPNKGYRVVDMTQDDLDEILQVRLMLEVPAAAEGRTAQHGSGPDAEVSCPSQRNRAARRGRRRGRVSWTLTASSTLASSRPWVTAGDRYRLAAAIPGPPVRAGRAGSSAES